MGGVGLGACSRYVGSQAEERRLERTTSLEQLHSYREPDLQRDGWVSGDRYAKVRVGPI